MSSASPEGVSSGEAVDLFRDDALLARFTEEYGPANTVRLLSETGDRTGVDCHPRAHQLGRIAYELFGSAAFSLSGHERHSGGYHGATEAFFHAWGTANLDTDIEAICGDSLNSFFRHQCVHGVGHGLMAWTSYEIFDALDLCDLLRDASDRLSCYSGIFMENVVGGAIGLHGPLHRVPFGGPALSLQHPGGQVHGALLLLPDVANGPAIRGGLRRGWPGPALRLPCRPRVCASRAWGRDVGGVSRGQPEKAIRLCYSVEDLRHRLDCLGGRGPGLLLGRRRRRRRPGLLRDAGGGAGEELVLFDHSQKGPCRVPDPRWAWGLLRPVGGGIPLPLPVALGPWSRLVMPDSISPRHSEDPDLSGGRRIWCSGEGEGSSLRSRMTALRWE